MQLVPSPTPEVPPLQALVDILEGRADFVSLMAIMRQGQSGTLDGAWGSSCALVAAAVARQLSAPVLVVLPRPAEVSDFLAELALFSSALSLPFPALESCLGDGEDERLDIAFPDRLALIKAPEPPKFTVTSIQALLQKLPSRAAVQASTRKLQVGQTLSPEALAQWLIQQGLKNVTAVEYPGEFSLRGGILDIFPTDSRLPYRCEFFDDQLESLRTFEPGSQRSVERQNGCELTLLPAQFPATVGLPQLLPPETCAILVEPLLLEEEAQHFLRTSVASDRLQTLSQAWQQLTELPSLIVAGIAAGTAEAKCHLPIETVERFSGDLNRVRDELDQAGRAQQIHLVCDSVAEVERLSEVFAQSVAKAEGRLQFLTGHLRHGFRLVAERQLVLSAGELLQRAEARQSTRRFMGRAIDSFLDLREGDLVVHVGYGVARYLGLKLQEQHGSLEEHLELEFHGGTRVFVPATKIGIVQKYMGGSKTRPTLARIGGTNWAKQKDSAAAAVRDLAAEMLQVQARRASLPGIAFPPASKWQQEFAAAFPYRETPDQLTAIAAIEQDMLRPRPMDRLLCGDVGFGKTEVAMRAAFKAVDAGYQVAVLVPTTILAEQHYQTFSKRMAEFPFSVEPLSRFCSPRQQRQTLAGLADGTIDIVIGTHRLAQTDVVFHNLGLLVIDEEQRFGVEIKEKLKALRNVVDVLTMTATPIPRTLHYSLLGLRDISNLETPPENRFPVETKVARFSSDLIRHALLRELNRGGQAYFIHNRIEDMEVQKRHIELAVPEARVAIGHGQMDEEQLERVMVEFVNGKSDVLLATTIVESGLDIPNANTIFINHADKHGLANLHQLRGRVGRSDHRAYCYLMIDEDRQLPPEAAKRLRAIEEFQELGAGFAIAMRDLEIRGAGNILGAQQSGHIAAIGYELYCELLEQAVRQLKQEAPRDKVEVTIDLPLRAYFPTQYVPDLRQKIDLYRRLTRLSRPRDVQSFLSELQDRFGAPPEAAQKLLALAEVRTLAHAWGIFRIRKETDYLVFDYLRRDKIRELARLHAGKLRIADELSAFCPLPNVRAEGEELLAFARSLLPEPPG